MRQRGVADTPGVPAVQNNLRELVALVSDFAPQGRPGYVVVNASMVEDMGIPVHLDHDQYLIVRDCPLCRKGAVTAVPAQGLWDWEHGEFAQNAFPDLTAAEREQVMTGTHADCWDLYMKEPEE